MQKTAKEYGKEAYRNGLPCDSAKDIPFIKELMKFSDPNAALREWVMGYVEATTEIKQEFGRPPTAAEVLYEKSKGKK